MHLRMALSGRSATERVSNYVDLCNAGKLPMLDIVEALLELYGWDDMRGEMLKTLLSNANSAYDVNATWSGLTLRVTPEVKAQVQAVVDAAVGSSGDHLRDAWNEAYGRAADPVKSYSESIKAVESAFAPIISPNNTKATLGTIIRDVRVKPSRWKFAIGDGAPGGVDTVLGMMQTLWDGQTSRHGGVATTRTETPAEARAAVHLSATLVQFAVGGSFKMV